MMDFDFDLLASPLNFAASASNFPDKIKDQMSDSYPYIWAKCSMIINTGFEQYSEGDFNFPMKEWITEDFKSVISQVVNDLKGFCTEVPITINDTITMHHFLYTMHFKIILITDFDDGLIKTDAKHLVEEDNDITLFFIQQNL